MSFAGVVLIESMKQEGAELQLAKCKREKRTGFIDMGNYLIYLKDGVPCTPPKSEYELAIDELDKEFPGAETKDISESTSQEKSVQSGIARFFSGAFALLGAGFILYYVYLLIKWIDTVLMEAKR